LKQLQAVQLRIFAIMKTLVVFGSTTGTTRILAQAVRKGLMQIGHDVVVRNARNQDPEEVDQFDLLAIGCSTWENGELQKDFRPFYEALLRQDLTGKQACVFGPGHSSYRQFCHAVDLIETALKEKGAQILIPSLRVDGSPYQARTKAIEWAMSLSAPAT
jgi:flavodoxin I